MLRVAIVFEYPTVNGGENSILAVLPRLIASGEIEAVALAEPTGPLSERLRDTGIPLQPFQLSDDSGTRLARDAAMTRLVEAVAASGCELVHSNSLAMGRLLGAAANRLNVPATSHLRDILKLSRAAIGDLNRLDRLLAVSDATRQFHVQQGLAPDRCDVVYNGINPDLFRREPEQRKRLRRELRIADDAVVVLTAGQIGLRKGLDTVASAAVELSQLLSNGDGIERNRGERDVVWLLAGERFSNKLESVEFEAAVTARFRAASPAVQFVAVGFRSDLPEVMSACDVLVHGARQEPLGRVLLEAAASRLAIVATRVGGTEEILRDDESALLVAPDAVTEMATAVRDLIENPERRSQLSRAAFERVTNHFSVESASDGLLTIWKRVLSDREITKQQNCSDTATSTRSL